MLKRLLLAAGIIAGLLTPAYPAGTISLSLSQQFDSQGKPLNGGRLYFFQAGTTTPQSAYQDSGLTIPYPNPIVLDSAGRVPQFFLADGSIKIRLESAAGVSQIAADGILVIGPSSGGGGGGGVDPTTIITTGDIKIRYDTGVLNGFVRLNGRTIGSATSGATERANADTQALFVHLCLVDPNLAMSPARSGNCANDFAANKQLALPDWRGRALAGLDDMGNSAAGILTASYFGTSATVLGAAGGVQSRALGLNELPPHGHPFSGNTNIQSNSHKHLYIKKFTELGAAIGTSFNAWSGEMAEPSGFADQDHFHSFSGTTGTVGVGAAFGTVTPTRLVTIYVKL